MWVGSVISCLLLPPFLSPGPFRVTPNPQEGGPYPDASGEKCQRNGNTDDRQCLFFSSKSKDRSQDNRHLELQPDSQESTTTQELVPFKGPLRNPKSFSVAAALVAGDPWPQLCLGRPFFMRAALGLGMYWLLAWCSSSLLKYWMVLFKPSSRGTCQHHKIHT